jgi:hypothetical protein
MGGMADYSWVTVNGHHFLPIGYGYDPQVAALFTEAEREPHPSCASEELAAPRGYHASASVL